MAGLADPSLSLKASTPLTWIMLMVYGVWHSAPFAFVVFYAGLQTLPQGPDRGGADRRRDALAADHDMSSFRI